MLEKSQVYIRHYSGTIKWMANQQNINNNFNLEWLAGFVDAEGFFSIHKSKKNYIFTFGIRVNLREDFLLKKIQSFLGFGNIYYDKKDNTVRYQVSNKNDLKKIVEIFTEIAPLRSKKIRDCKLFKKALLINNQEKIQQLWNLNSKLKKRQFNSRKNLSWEWFLGFLEGDGCFGVNIKNLPEKIYCYFNIVQKDYYILKKIQNFIKLGNITKKNKYDLWSYDIGKRTNLEILINQLNQLQFQSNAKYSDYQIWSYIISEIKLKNHLNPKNFKTLNQLKKKMYIYKKFNELK